MAIRLFEVGGHVRDSLLGIESKDIDMAVEAPSYEAMLEFVESHTRKVIRDKNGTPIGSEFLTIRAIGHDGLGKDYVLCRKDGDYSDGRRPDSVEPGTIIDDLRRRDFTVNAIARDVSTGEILDPFGGQQDLKISRLKCVGLAEERFSEDALRILRAARFCITKNFWPDDEISFILSSHASSSWCSLLQSVSPERIREELYKCFNYDTVKTMWFLQSKMPGFIPSLFNDRTGIWLKPTMEKR